MKRAETLQRKLDQINSEITEDNKRFAFLATELDRPGIQERHLEMTREEMTEITASLKKAINLRNETATKIFKLNN